VLLHARLLLSTAREPLTHAHGRQSGALGPPELRQTQYGSS
jgi:hypothetical protein